MNNIFTRTLAILRLIIFVLVTLILVAVHTIWYVLTRRMDVPTIFHRFCCFIFNIKVKINGHSAHTREKPVIYLVNHISYLDIIILGSIVDGCFVAKSEVSSWPGFGFLAKLQKTIFIRRDKAALKESRTAIASAMHNGYDIILFPEGTSTDGWDVMQFKAGLLGIFFPDDKAGTNDDAILNNALIQPLAIKHISTNGITVTKDRQDLRDLYAWYGDMDLVPHLWKLAHTKNTVVELHYLPVLSPHDFANRFDISNAAQEYVAKVIREG